MENDQVIKTLLESSTQVDPEDGSPMYFTDLVRKNDIDLIYEYIARKQRDGSDGNIAVDEGATAVAAKNGNLEILEVLKRLGCPFSTWTHAYAALRNHKDIIIWLYENNYDWDESLATHAAAFGFIDLLELLHENDGPIDEQAYINAVRYGHQNVVEWLEKNNYPREIESGWRYTGAVLNEGTIKGTMRLDGYFISAREKERC